MTSPTPDLTLDASSAHLDAPAASPPRQPLSKKLVPALGGLAVGAAMGVALAHFSGNALIDGPIEALKARYGGWAAPLLIGTMIAAGWTAIALHELGHLLGGLAVRFRFHFYVAGPLRVDRGAGDRLRVGWNRELGLAGGVASLLPTDPHALPRRLAVLVVGGPAASLLVAAATLALAPLPALGPEAGFAAAALGILSGAIFLATLVPMRAGGFVSDGGRLLRLLRGGAVAEREAAVLALVALSAAGTPPREWPADLVHRGLEPRDGSLEECSGATLAYCHALDAGDVDGAARHLDRALGLLPALPPLMAPSLYAEAAYFQAAHRGRADAARAWLARIPTKAMMVKPYDRARAEAAVALAEGDLAGAARLAREGLAALPAYCALERAGLEELLRRAEAPAG